MQLITHQTGPEGQKVRNLLIEEGADIKNEYYVAALTDRATQSVAVMALSEGGMDIEEVAAHSTPEKIVKEFINPLVGLTDEQAAENLASGMGMNEASIPHVSTRLEEALHLLHGNRRFAGGNQPADPRRRRHRQGARRRSTSTPTPYRHQEIVAMRDLDEEDADEIEASKFDLAHISWTATSAVWRTVPVWRWQPWTPSLFGAEPANFSTWAAAPPPRSDRSLQDHASRTPRSGHFVNIFGGIMRCDTIATGVVTAAREVHLSVPLVVRMKGTNEDIGGRSCVIRAS